MAEKSSKLNGVYFLWITIGTIVGGYIGGAMLNAALNLGGMSFASIVKALGDNATLTYAFICWGLVFIFVMLNFTGFKSGGVKMKGKDDMENQRWLEGKELDQKFAHSKYSELQYFECFGIPIRSVIKGKDMIIHFDKEKHYIIIGSTGTGKTVTFVEPTVQILAETKTKPSLFITDTKGEIFAHHSQKLKEQGYKVFLFDLVDAYNSLRWNPLQDIYETYQRALHLEQEIFKHVNDSVDNYKFTRVGEINNSEWYEFSGKAFPTLREALIEVEVEKSKLKDECFEDIEDISAALCPVTPGKDQSWDQGAKDYLKGIILAMLEDSENDALGMTKERFNFYNVYKIAMNKDDDFQVMKDYFSGRSPLSRTVQLTSHILQSKAQTTRDSYLSLLTQRLSMFADNGICLLTSINDIDFTTFDDQPTAFFIKIPDERETRYTIASICVSQAYKQFVRKARDNEFTTGKPCLKRPLFYIMDEFANMPKVAQLDKMITVSRSRKIFFNMVIQSFAQLENVYSKEIATTVKGNCSIMYLGTNDLATNEEISKSLGNYTITVESKSKQDEKGKDGTTGSSTSSSYQTRPLIYAAELDKLTMGNTIVKTAQSYPVKSYMTPYFKFTPPYKIGKMDLPFIPGRRLNEQEIYYDLKRRNNIVLDNE